MFCKPDAKACWQFNIWGLLRTKQYLQCNPSDQSVYARGGIFSRKSLEDATPGRACVFLGMDDRPDDRCPMAAMSITCMDAKAGRTSSSRPQEGPSPAIARPLRSQHSMLQFNAVCAIWMLLMGMMLAWQKLHVTMERDPRRHQVTFCIDWHSEQQACGRYVRHCSVDGHGHTEQIVSSLLD